MKLEEVSNIDYCWIDSRGKREIYIYTCMCIRISRRAVTNFLGRKTWRKATLDASRHLYLKREKKKKEQTNKLCETIG